MDAETAMAQRDWDEYFFGMCDYIATKSKDQSTKVGAIVVGPHHEIRTSGWNDFPRGVIDDLQERRDKPMKYDFTEHAERNAIFNAARVGIPLNGCTMYIPWFPCTDCARAIIQVGINELVCLEPDFEDRRWGVSHERASDMLREANINVRYFNPSTTVEIHRR
jgi:dCMP deaminase